MSKINLNRRIMLRGLGGALLAAPFLSSLFERSSKAAATAGPKRTILMYTAYGCITNNWFPAKLDGDLLDTDLLPTSLAPLAPFAKKLLIPRGMRTMNEWTADNKGPGTGRGQGNDVHTQVTASALTCQPVTPNSDDPFSFNSATKFQALPLGPSLDHVIAQQLSADGTPLLMNIAGMTKESPQSAISYSDSQKIYDPVNAAGAFSQLTGILDLNSPVNADTWAVSKGKAISDLVKDDLSTLARKDMSKADKDKLAAWVALTNDVGRAISATCSRQLAMKLGATNTIASGEGDVVTRKVSATMDNADVYSAIAALTAACNVNPVVVLKYPNNFVFSGLGINADSDNLNHRLNQASMVGPCVANVIELLLKLDRYYAQKFANLVQMLDSIPEGDGRTVLDNSAVVWTMEDSDGCAHNLNNHPFIQAGSAGGYFKTGKIIHLDPTSGATPEQMLGRSTAQCGPGSDMQADGISQATGTDAKYGNAPVNKYYCNIMNAMGLKADANGFPAKDGQASEVIRFGYSDKTEEFSGGFKAAPDAQIHSPGGFSELKA